MPRNTHGTNCNIAAHPDELEYCRSLSVLFVTLLPLPLLISRPCLLDAIAHWNPKLGGGCGQL